MQMGTGKPRSNGNRGNGPKAQAKKLRFSEIAELEAKIATLKSRLADTTSWLDMNGIKRLALENA